MASRKDVKKEIRKLEREGFVVEQASSGHYSIFDPDTGEKISTIGSTPSDFRSIRNFRAQLRPARMALRQRRSEAQMPYVTTDPEVVQRDVRLRERIRDMLKKLEASKEEFAVYARATAQATGIRGYKTDDAAKNALTRYLNGGRPTEWGAQMYEVALASFQPYKGALAGMGNGDQPAVVESADKLEVQPTSEESAAVPEPAMVVQEVPALPMSVHDLPAEPAKSTETPEPVKVPTNEQDLLEFPLHMRVMVGLLKPGLDVASVLGLVEEIRRLEKQAGIY